jgi:hypothetical protein
MRDEVQWSRLRVCCTLSAHVAPDVVQRFTAHAKICNLEGMNPVYFLKVDNLALCPRSRTTRCRLCSHRGRWHCSLG